MAVVQGLVFIVGSLLLTIFSLKKLRALPGRIFNLGLFLGIFLIVGSLVNGMWSCLIYDHFYHSSDYVFDFVPFWPLMWNVDPPHVEGYGTTLFGLGLIWFAFAAFTWAVTILLYRVICRKIQKVRQRKMQVVTADLHG